MAKSPKLMRMLGGSIAALAIAMSVQPAQAQERAGDIDAAIDASTGPSQALAYARSQAGQGDLLGAAATLERALFDRTASGTADVRAFYIVVLCRLDDRERALVEAGKFGTTRVGESAWAEVEQACGAIPRPTAAQVDRRSLTGELSAGFTYDQDNLGAINQFFSAPEFRIPGDDGISFVANLALSARLPAGRGYVYAAGDALTKDSLDGPALNYQVFSGRLGYGLQVGAADLSFGPVATYIRLQGADLGGEVGGQARLRLPGPGRGQWVTSGEIVYQNYAGSFPFFSRDGTRYDLALHYQKETNAGVSYVLGAGAEYKTAETVELGYTAGRVFGAVRFPLGVRGVYSAISGTIRHLVYRTPDFGDRQIETRYFVRAALGLPVSIKGVAVEAAGSYTRRDYNIDFLQDYSSLGAELRMVWRFGK
ncbi:MAG: hypothetical protein K2P68_02405 [Sphingomonas sp.]|nr:hypothetical protein [Sphingomonas sp.]